VQPGVEVPSLGPQGPFHREENQRTEDPVVGPQYRCRLCWSARKRYSAIQVAFCEKRYEREVLPGFVFLTYAPARTCVCTHIHTHTQASPVEVFAKQDGSLGHLHVGRHLPAALPDSVEVTPLQTEEQAADFVKTAW
jgi:hypothetical protein